MVDNNAISELMIDVGFNRSDVKNMFFVGKDDFLPSILLKSISKKNQCRLTGSLGLVCPKFENLWKSYLNKIEKKVDNNFSISSHIDNFVTYLDDEFYGYSSSETEIRDKCEILYRYLMTFPKNEDEFRNACCKNNFGGKPFSTFLNIADYFEIENLYQRKSINFLYWITKNGFATPESILNILPNSQISILKYSENPKYILPELQNNIF